MSRDIPVIFSAPMVRALICGKHWQSTPRHWRRKFFLFRHRGRHDLEQRMWDRLKARAIEAAAGL